MHTHMYTHIHKYAKYIPDTKKHMDVLLKHM